MGPFLTLLLYGDVEFHLGQTNQQKNNKSTKQDSTQEFLMFLDFDTNNNNKEFIYSWIFFL